MANTTGKADHKANTSTLPGLTTARIQAITALAVNLASTISAGLALAGLNPLPFTSDQVSAGVLGAIALISAVYNWWTHLTVTKAGYEGKQLTAAIKNASLDPVIPDTSQTATANAPIPLETLYEKDDKGDTVTDPVTGTPVIRIG